MNFTKLILKNRRIFANFNLLSNQTNHQIRRNFNIQTLLKKEEQLNSVFPKETNNEQSKSEAKFASITPKLALIYTCKVCSTRQVI